MSKEIPVFTTPATGVDAVITDKWNGRICETDTSFSQAIIDTISHKTYQQMGINARLHVEKLYNIRDIAKQYFKFLS